MQYSDLSKQKVDSPAFEMLSEMRWGTKVSRRYFAPGDIAIRREREQASSGRAVVDIPLAKPRHD